MRYRIAAKRYRKPVVLIVRTEDGQVRRVEQNAVQRRLDVGETGRIVQGRKGMRFVPDAIDA